LGFCLFILQEHVKFIDFLAVPHSNVRMIFNPGVVRRSGKRSFDIFLLYLQLPQLVPDNAWIAVTFGDEVQATPDATFRLLQLLGSPSSVLAFLFPNSIQFSPERGGKFVDQVLAAEENAAKSGEDPFFQFDC